MPSDRIRESATRREVSEWFCLGNYEAARTMSPQSWAYEVQRRLLLKMLLDTPQQEESLAQLRLHLAHQALREITAQPIVGKASRELPAFQSFSGGALENWAAIWLLADPENSLYEPVWINRGATDHDLRAGLEKYLVARSQKSTAKLAPGVGYATRLQRWHAARVLPYADLKLWEYVHSKTLTEAEKVHFLFTPDTPFDSRSPERSGLKKARDAFKQLFRVEQVWALASYVPARRVARTKKVSKKSSS